MLIQNSANVNPQRENYAIDSSLPFRDITRENFTRMLDEASCDCCRRLLNPIDAERGECPTIDVAVDLFQGKVRVWEMRLCFNCSLKAYIDALRKVNDPFCEPWFNIVEQTRENFKKGLI